MAGPSDDGRGRRREVVEAARRQIGTPYRHQGRVAGLALDCVGLLVLAAREAGCEVVDCEAYGPLGDADLIERFMAQNAAPIAPEQVEPGDILGLRVGRGSRPLHLALRTDLGLLHTDARLGRVVEHGMDRKWFARVVAAWRLPAWHRSHS